MIHFSASKFVKFALSVTAFIAQTAFAAPVTISGALTASDPTFNRPSSLTVLSPVGTNVAYDVYSFNVTEAGAYSFESTSFSAVDSDTYAFIYQNVFNASSPTTNLVALDDDGGDGSLSLVTTPLQAGIQYFLVFTSFYNGDFGSYTGVFNTVSGTGQVVLGNVTADVPEPGSIALIVLALAGMTMLRRRAA